MENFTYKKSPIGKDFIPIIIDAVSRHTGIPPTKIIIKTRKREIVQARQIAMTFASFFTGCSLAVIGKEIGGKDHATVLHAKRTISNVYDVDASVRKMYADIYNDLFDRINDVNLIVCSMCGSHDVKSLSWSDPNKGSMILTVDLNNPENNFCNTCNANAVLIRLALFQKAIKNQQKRKLEIEHSNVERKRTEEEKAYRQRQKKKAYENQLAKMEKELGVYD